ncbi:MAG: MerR family transcriptional regulator, partial [Xanthobacteraceae bacterium]
MEKAPDAFRTISEVASEIDVPQHVLRFWESRFPQIRPMKRGGGRRYYRPDDVDLLRGIRHLLYGEGYTIRGVQRILREQGMTVVQTVWRVDAELPPSEEDQTAEASSAQSTEPRLEPNLFAVADERREPRLEGAPAPQPPAPRRLAEEARHKLQAALDELAACRGLI